MMRSRTKIRSFATLLGLLYILLLDPAFVTSAPVSVEEGDYDVEGGCFYMLEFYQNGEQIRTNEPCLNCTCSNNMLMCYLKTCPFTKPIGSDCKVERIPGLCCPIIKCPEVPVMIPESHPFVPVAKPQVIATTEISVSQHIPSTTALSLLNNEKGCHSNEVFYVEGSQVPSSSDDACDLCYCIQNHTACVKQSCVLEIPGCTPQFKEGVCCPIGYKCDSSVTFTSTTTTTTTTTTTAPAHPSTGCYVDGEFHYDGSNIVTGEACNHCYCMRGKVVCAVQVCDPPIDECVSVSTNDHCCPIKYDCSNSADSWVNGTEEFSDLSTTVETRLDDDVSQEVEHSQTLPSSIEVESSTDETISITKIEPDEKPEELPTSTIFKEDDKAESESTTVLAEQFAPEERLKSPNEKPQLSNDSTSVPIIIASEEPSILTTNSPLVSEEIPFTTEENVQIDISTKLPIAEQESTTLLHEHKSVTTHSLQSDSQIIEQESTTTFISKSEAPEEALLQTTMSSAEIETTQLPEKVPEIVNDEPESTTSQIADVHVPIETTLSPELNEPALDSTTALPVKEVDTKTEKLPASIVTTSEALEIELATTEQQIFLESTKEATTEVPAVLDTTLAKVEDEQSNEVINLNKPTVPSDSEVEFETSAVPLTTVPQDLPAENRFELTEASTNQSSDDITIRQEMDISTTEASPAFGDIITNAPEEKTELPNFTTDVPEHITQESATPAVVKQSVDDSNFDAIPGEGDCLQKGVTFNNGDVVPSSNICHENCTCNNSIIACDKIRCEKPISFRHLICTEVFEDKSCCPQYICESSEKGSGILEAANLVTVAPLASDDSASTSDNIEATTSILLEHSTASSHDDKPASDVFINEELTSTFVPETIPETKPEFTTVAPKEITVGSLDQQLNDQSATTKVDVIEAEQDQQDATTEAIASATDISIIKEDVSKERVDISSTPIPESVPANDEQPQIATTEKDIESESVDDATTVLLADKLVTKEPEIEETELATTAAASIEKELETTIKQEVVTDTPDIATTASEEKLKTEQPIKDQEAVATEVIESSSLLPVSDEKPITTNEILVQNDEVPPSTSTPILELDTRIKESVKLVTTERPEDNLVEELAATQQPLLGGVVAHDEGFVTEEILQSSDAFTEKPIIVEDKPLQENPTTRLSISVEVVTPDPIVTTDIPQVESKTEKVESTNDSTQLSPEQPSKDTVLESSSAKPEELPEVETTKSDVTSPIAITEETLVEDDDPHQTVDGFPFTSTILPKIKEILISTVALIKEKESTKAPIIFDNHTEAVLLATTSAKEEDDVTKEQQTTHHLISHDVIPTTSVPEILPVLLTTTKLVPGSQVLEHAAISTEKYVNITTPSIEFTTEAHLREHTKTTLLLPTTTAHSTTTPVDIHLSTTASIVNVTTTSATPSEKPTTKAAERTTTFIPETTTRPTTTPIPALSQHLPADDKESIGQEAPLPDHHDDHDYEEPTEDYILPDLGIPITSDNFTLDDGDCVYESRLYKSAQQIPRGDPCDFCFCFRGDIICLQQSCPPPIDGCYEETIPGFCCPRFECPVTAVTLNVSDTKVPYPISASRYRSIRAVPQVQVVVCEFRSKFYSRGESIKEASSPCMDCMCAENGTMKCAPKKCQLDPFWHSLHGLKKSDKIDTKRAGRNRY